MAAELRIIHYRPTALSLEEWAIWGDSTIEVLRAMEPQTADQAKTWASTLAAFAANATKWGLSPPLQDVLTPGNVERHVDSLTGIGTSRSHRTLLKKIGRTIDPTLDWDTQREVIGRSDRQPPYSYVESASIERAAEHQTPPSLAQLFQVGYALGDGAGLDGRTNHLVKPKHLVFDQPGSCTLTDFKDLPDITITGASARWLQRWSAETKPGQGVIGPKSRMQGRAHLLRADDGVLRVEFARLRTTYVVRLIESGLGLPELMAATGVTTAGALDLYLPFVQDNGAR